MAKVILRQKAIEDLNDIWDYTLKEWSESQADKYYAMLKFDCLQLGETPKIGKTYFGISKNLFGFRSGKHIIFYQLITDEEIEIVRILHERMDLKNRMNK